ncbi:MAG: IS607 family transposase [Bacteroidales bacterium]
MENEYVTPQTLTKMYGITSTTLRNWAESGKIKFIRPLGGRRLYHKEDARQIFRQTETQNQDQNENTRKRILYARVSSAHQTEDLKRQIQFLQSKYPTDTLIKDIGSGLNWKRKGLETILEQIYQGNISEIVVAYKDRLCRFGYELFEWICQKHDTKILVLNPISETEDRTKELVEDLFSIVTVFVAKNNGLRSSRNRQIRHQSKEDQDAPQPSTEDET